MQRRERGRAGLHGSPPCTRGDVCGRTAAGKTSFESIDRGRQP